MVASEKINFAGELDFVGKEETDGLNALPASVHVVPEEKIGGVRRETTVLKHTQHVSELAVNISANFDWRVDFYKHALLQESRLGQANNTLDFSL